MINKKLKLSLKIFGGFIALLLVVTGGLVAYISYELRPDVLTQNIKELLTEALGTQVELKRCELRVFKQELEIKGLCIKDRKNVDMLSLDDLGARVDLYDLWHNRLKVEGIKLDRARLILYKEKKDSAANFQFVVDAFTVISRERTKAEKQQQKKAKLKWDVRYLELSNISVKWDIKSEISRNSPEFRKQHPHRGHFDPNHMDVNLSLVAKNIYMQGDSASLRLDHLDASEKFSGLIAKEVTADLEQVKTKFYARNLHVKSTGTTMDAPLVSFTIPSKKVGAKFSLKGDDVKIHAVLMDIAKPFAPVLYKFTTPIEATTNVVGTDSCFRFNDIHVFTNDKNLNIKAYGGISFPKMGTKLPRQPKYDTFVWFKVSSLVAKAGIKKQIVGHFAKISSSLSTLLVDIGDIRFKGGIDIPYKHEHIYGTITTAVGKINANVTLNDENKTMQGTVSSNGINVSKLTGKEGLENVAFNANCNLDIAKHEPKNKMPIGKVNGVVKDIVYKKFRLKNITFNAVSDGTNVSGDIDHDKRIVDLGCGFSFKGTDIKNTLKIKPHVKIKMGNLWHATGIPKLWNSIFGKKKTEVSPKTGKPASAEKGNKK